MSDQANQPSQTPEPERAEHASCFESSCATKPEHEQSCIVAIGIIGLFLVLLAIGVIPRMRNHQELAAAAQKAQNTVPEVYVVRPQAASEADLTLAATTQAIQDAIIYARTSGYLRKRYVDIGDQVTAGQLLAEIESPEIYQQLQQAQADLQQSEKNLDLQKANLDLARTTWRVTRRRTRKARSPSRWSIRTSPRTAQRKPLWPRQRRTSNQTKPTSSACRS